MYVRKLEISAGLVTVPLFNQVTMFFCQNLKMYLFNQNTKYICQDLRKNQMKAEQYLMAQGKREASVT